MKVFFSVFEFEFWGYIKSKVYWGVTLAVISIICILMFIPRIIEFQNTESVEKEGLLVICDGSDRISVSDLEDIFNYEKIEKIKTENEVKRYIESGKANAGFVINNLTNFTYYVYNSSFTDDNAYYMEQYLEELNKRIYCECIGIDYDEFILNSEVEIIGNTNILGKDSISNYAYCYVLVSIIFIVIIFYGNMIATSITTEKSGRISEILVTSTNTRELLFGKVLAGAMAVLIQVSLILLTVLAGYKLNYKSFDETIQMMFKIPLTIVVIFSLFGILGFIFYSFLFGGLGAMLSKTEEVQNASLPLQLLLMVIYMFAIFELKNVDGLLFKIGSYLPISSCFTMFVRCAMGTVSIYESILSFVILFVSVIIIGIVVSKKYKKNILNYGNKISLFKKIL